jgi:hypothetical protein
MLRALDLGLTRLRGGRNSATTANPDGTEVVRAAASRDKIDGSAGAARAALVVTLIADAAANSVEGVGEVGLWQLKAAQPTGTRSGR